jgi:hypothetical protein
MYTSVVLPGVIDVTYDEFLYIKPFSGDMALTRRISPVNCNNIPNLRYVIDHKGVHDII